MRDGDPRQHHRHGARTPRHPLLIAALALPLSAAAQLQPATQPPTAQPATEIQPAPAPPTGLQSQLAQLVAAPAVARAHWGIAVSTLDGRPLVTLNAAQLFHPASNAKLLTTAAAIALLGPGDTVTTRIEARGPLTGGTLTGDLALVGAGDADFATNDIPYQPPAPNPHHAQPTPPEDASTPAPLHALEAMADHIAATGLHTITGDIIGDDTVFAWEPYPDDWAQDDLLWGYGAPIGALALHDNQIALHLRADTATGLAATLEPGMPPWFTLDTTALSLAPPGSAIEVGLGRVPGDPRTLRLWGTLPAPGLHSTKPVDDAEQLALPDPALYAAQALRDMLLARGITVSGIARAQHRLPLATASLREQASQPLPLTLNAIPQPASPYQTLATATSPTLLEDEIATNKLSLNLHAELLLERLGQRFGAQPINAQDPAADAQPTTNPTKTTTKTITNSAADPASRAQGLRVLRSILPRAGIDPDDIVLVDGSGLSTHDLVTPRALVQLLTWSAAQPWSAAWRSTLPIGGVDGSLANRFRKPPLTGRVLAKTGTLGESRALSGYLTCASGRTVAFSILVDNHTPGSTADRDTMDQIVAALYAAL